MARILLLVDRFPSVVQRLSSRRVGREPLAMRDEYDVQSLFYELLETRFEDIRPEEWDPATREFVPSESFAPSPKWMHDGR